MEIAIEQLRSLDYRKPTKTKQMQRPFFNKLSIKAKEELILSYLFFQFLLGVLSGTPYEMLVPRCEGICSM